MTAKRRVPNVRQLAARLSANRRRIAVPDDHLVAGDPSMRLAVLEGVSVFFMQPKSAVRKLARQAQQVSVKKGDALVRQGMANENLYVVMRGQFAALVEASGGDSLPIAMLGPLDVFGVLSVVSRNPAAATVTAMSDGEVLVIEGKQLIAQMDDPGSATTQLQRVAAQRLALLEGARHRTRIPTGLGTLVAVYSPKGGAGKTTIALNLSAALAASHPGQVALLDLGLPYNDAALVSGQVPTTCLARVVDIDGAFDELVLGSMLQHPARFSILPVVLKPEEADLITPDVVSRSVETLRSEFKYVVVDCCVQLLEQVLSVLERAQHVVLITTPRLPSLKDVPHLLDILQDVLHIPTGRIHLTVNHTTSRAAIGRVEIERIVGRRTTVEVGFDATAERAAIRGELLSKVRPAGPVAMATAQLAARINGRPVVHHGLDLASVTSRLGTLRRRGFA
jgi:Flp pilus assembly CpaE family ATPase